MTVPPIRLALVVLLSGVLAWLAIDRLVSQRDSARLERDNAQFERDGLRQAARITGERLAIAADNDRKNTQELTDALNNNQELRRAVADGDQRLLVNATCPAHVSTSAGTGGVADAAGAELRADARSDYFTLKDQLALSRQMILGLQDHVRSFCTTQTQPGAHHEQ
ncbi:prophage endopeptidase [Pseudomonas sp. UC 17F4]|uniref:lysis system i-spanin subunit Rz n=1 Tax=Pseudomonas sp. UC 17F4 TaxID=1855328 RepID=UPI00088CFB23|nr:lysis system i-spanin subunit Rz [Pseudomonas sp. UC 17F4]SDQ54993.1 prophage endopeptidase [Pseudomonas sp. UC 17F4]